MRIFQGQGHCYRLEFPIPKSLQRFNYYQMRFATCGLTAFTFIYISVILRNADGAAAAEDEEVSDIICSFREFIFNCMLLF